MIGISQSSTSPLDIASGIFNTYNSIDSSTLRQFTSVSNVTPIILIDKTINNLIETDKQFKDQIKEIELKK